MCVYITLQRKRKREIVLFFKPYLYHNYKKIYEIRLPSLLWNHST